MKESLKSERKPVAEMAHILLVDDDDVDVMTVKRAFKKRTSGHRIDVARDGVEALEFLRGAERLPDVVLLDVNMPRMGGLELLRVIREDERLSRLNIVMLTTSKAHQDVLAAYELHVASYIVKPVDYEKFLEAVSALDRFWAISHRPDAA